MNEYNHKKIEKRWQEKWKKEKLYQVDLGKAKKPFYNLMMFPYPSAEGLHVGNMYAFVHSDTYGRFKRLQGYDVFEPIGLDGFGIHSENYAIKIKEHIKDVSARTEKKFYEQLHMIGNAYDWSRTVETYKPNYYKWTQWLFLKMYEKGLAYRKESSVNWCPSCKTVLSDEQVIGGKCERCEAEVAKKQMKQWFWRITDYADKLLKNLEQIDWSEDVKTIQRNWIGKSEGALVKFCVIASEAKQSRVQSDKNGIATSRQGGIRNDSVVEVFTTRPDTLFGCTYFVVAPEHPMIGNWKLEIGNWKEVESYIKKAKKKSEIERTDLAKEKTGVKLEGLMAINPVNNEAIPIFVADYVLMGYGTGAIMAVPAHDERDFEFAKKYKLKITPVNIPVSDEGDNKIDFLPKDYKLRKEGEVYCTDYFNKKIILWIYEGYLINSGKYNWLRSDIAAKKIIKWLEKNKLGKKEINYKLRDWCISRQRYWGPPIPMIECPKCGWVPVLEKDLPVELPEMDDFLPDGTGKGPLNKIKEFVNTTCPQCGGPAKRETDVSDPFVDSSWYFMRYLCTDFNNKALDKKRLEKWMPVDMYIGGKEHSVLHLLYSRFVTMVMHDLGYAPEAEPYKRFRAHGLLIAEGAKISKSKGNIINPDEYIEKYGADAVRMYLMFLGDMRQGGDWQDTGMAGMSKFISKICNYFESWQKTYNKDVKDSKKNIEIYQESGDEWPDKRISVMLHKTINKVTTDLENLKYNTAISALMIFLNYIRKEPIETGKKFTEELNLTIPQLEKFLVILAPFAPHLAEELWFQLGNKDSIFKQKWPKYDKDLVKDEMIELVIQVNGKLRDKLKVSADISEAKAKKLALDSEKIKKWIDGKKVIKVIFVKGKLVNIVVK